MAGSLNSVMLIGRLGKDPESRFTQSGAQVVSFSLATDESYTKDGQKVEQTEWHRCVAWNKTADLIAKYLHKGSLVYVSGKLQTRQWQDQQGQTRYTTEINVFQVQFLESKNQAQGGQGYQQPSTQPQQQQNQRGPQNPQSSQQMDEAPF
jgi:single-strand DNA-binding protein